MQFPGIFRPEEHDFADDVLKVEKGASSGWANTYVWGSLSPHLAIESREHLKFRDGKRFRVVTKGALSSTKKMPPSPYL